MPSIFVSSIFKSCIFMSCIFSHPNTPTSRLMDQDTQRIQVVFSDCPTKWPEIITVEVTECFTYLGSGTYWFRCKHIGHVQAYQRLAATQMEPDYEVATIQRYRGLCPFVRNADTPIRWTEAWGMPHDMSASHSWSSLVGLRFRSEHRH